MPKSLCEGERGEPKYIRGEIDLDLTALTFSNHLNIIHNNKRRKRVILGDEQISPSPEKRPVVFLPHTLTWLICHVRA